jgi:hypothetical protein
VSNLTQRRLLPGLLSAALSSRPNPAEHAVLGERLRQLAAAQGAVGAHKAADVAGWDAAVDAYLAQRAEQGWGSPLTLVGDVQLALFGAGHALHAVLLAPAGSAEASAAAGRAAGRLAALQGALCALCQHVAKGLAPAPGAGGQLGVLPLGAGACLASALVCEEGVWVAGCLQVGRGI